MTTRRAFLGASAGAVATPALAQAPIRWRMATSWTRNLPGPGISARRLAERIQTMSAGRLVIDLFAAGEIVPAFAVFDAVSTGTVEMGHTASFFWQGKLPGAALFTTAPFGMGPIEHQAWIAQRGGQALWDELYRRHGVKAWLAGNTGPSMGGWFRKQLTHADETAGLRIRVQGLGAEVYAKLGATPQAIPPGDVLPALERGAIDAVELLAPVNDLPSGFQRHAPFYHMPGFNKPNGAGEAIVSLKSWETLPPDLRRIVEVACDTEHAAALAEAERTNAEALTSLIGSGASIVPFPIDMIERARKAATAVLDETAAQNSLARRIVASYREAANAGRPWASLQATMARVIRGN